MTPEQAARRWRQAKIARQRRDVELETFPTTGGSKSKNAHPMFGSRTPRPTTSRTPGLARRLPAPGGLTTWGTINPAAIEHVGGGYHLVSCIVHSEDAGWYDAGDHVKWAVAVWLIRPDGTISDAWLSDGNTVRPYTQGGTADASDAPPYGEPSYISAPKLTRWQEGALLSFTVFTSERQFVNDLSGFWPQSATYLDVPYGANVYRWVGHDGVDPVIGDALELYGGADADFGSSGDWDLGGGTTNFDDLTTEGYEVVAPSADANIAIYGLADNSGRHRVWLLDKDGSNDLTLTARTTFTTLTRIEPGGLTRVAADRWVAMADSSPGMAAWLFNAKTGTVVDDLTFDDGTCLAYALSAAGVFYATNHLHYNGTDVFAGWAKSIGGVFASRYTTLTFDGDDLQAGTISTWDTDADLGANSARFVETCEGCLRIVSSWQRRQQALFEGGRVKAGPVELPTPEFEYGTVYDDQRVVPSSHPAGLLWAVNVSMDTQAYGSNAQVEPWLIRYPA